MHQVILDRLEEHLSGSPSPREFTAHLESCEECRTEVREMQELSGALGFLRIRDQVAPPPGFYARVSQRLEAERPRSLWSLFRLDPSFGKRVAFASLMTLAILGSFLITRESQYSAGPARPELIMAQQPPSDNPDMMLATLASYEP
ncbi:MAG: putative transrane anti-sigma factor [Bryobacterales bacterium]|nr:putative transrane anti-sigma factor [Bryobacterales bacterium]